ncbi:MAG: 3'-5' exonuclease [Treponema sp.]|nr:3'-5' exonuclease [Treponema sp.]
MLQTKLLKDYKRLPRLLADETVFCVFDTETTGLDSRSDRVIEIGAVKCILRQDSVEILETFDQLINPGIPLPSVCMEVSHITDDMVAGKPAIADVLPDFLRFIDGTVLVAHNAPFDLKFMNAELSRAGLPVLSNLTVDTLQLSRQVYPANGHWNLQFLAKQFSIDVQAAHRACDDARVCMEVLLRCIKDMKA